MSLAPEKMTLSQNEYVRPAGFLFLLGGVAFTAMILNGALPTIETPDGFATAVLIDLLVVVPLCYYLLMVRGQSWPVVSLGPVIIGCLIVAHLVIPSDHAQMLSYLTYLAAPIELGIGGFVLYRTVRSIRRAHRAGASVTETDLLSRLRHAFRTTLESRRIADIVAYELAVLYYAVLSWRHTPVESDARSGTYSYHRTSGHDAMLFVIIIAVVVELVATHILLHMWSPTAAWIHTGLVAYGMFWLFGDYRAAKLRPIAVTGDSVLVRCGLRWEVEIAREMIVSAHAASWKETKGDDYLSLALASTETVVLEMADPVTVKGPYGITRTPRRIGLSVDNTNAFLQQLNG